MIDLAWLCPRCIGARYGPALGRRHIEEPPAPPAWARCPAPCEAHGSTLDYCAAHGCQYDREGAR